MTAIRDHISVCICTYRRPEWLRRLLDSLQSQRTDGLFAYSIVVADNDATESARPVVESVAKTSAVPVTYCVEPTKNIAMVRNKTIEAARGNWIAFIDDDEFPVPEWLLLLFRACQAHGAQGVLGPVRSHYDDPPPSWVPKCGLFDRPEFPTGYVLSWGESRTGNVLFRRDILPADGPAFDPAFHNGGEDQVFFRRMMAQGHKFIWCNEAIAYETVPPIRWDKKIMMQRALLRGQNSFRQSKRFHLGLVKSLVAIPLYLLVLPVLYLVADHLFMRYAVKLCDHLGRIQALVGFNLLRERVG